MSTLLFLHGPPAAGKYSIGQRVAAALGWPLFHNHLVVDAVHAVFPFGSPAFVRLREAFWLEVMAAAAAEGRSLVFTFQPEPSVSHGFPAAAAGLFGRCHFVQLRLGLADQLARVANPDRARFGKLVDPALLHRLHPGFAAAEAAMPPSVLSIDTATSSAEAAAAAIVALVDR